MPSWYYNSVIFYFFLNFFTGYKHLLMSQREVPGSGCTFPAHGVPVQLTGCLEISGHSPGSTVPGGFRGTCVLEVAPRVVIASWTGGKPVFVCFLAQWRAGPRGIWRSRDGRKNPSDRLGAETEEAFFG